MCHLCMCTAHGIYRSCRHEKLARRPWFLGQWNHIETNIPFEVDQHWRTLSVFGTGRSATLIWDQFMSKHFEWIYQESWSYQSGLSTLQLDKKHLRSVIVFLDVVVNEVESQRGLKNVWATRAERLENLFANVSVQLHPGKTFWETS